MLISQVLDHHASTVIWLHHKITTETSGAELRDFGSRGTHNTIMTCEQKKEEEDSYVFSNRIIGVACFSIDGFFGHCCLKTNKIKKEHYLIRQDNIIYNLFYKIIFFKYRTRNIEACPILEKIYF